jgi:hypothetical protein
LQVGALAQVLDVAAIDPRLGVRLAACPDAIGGSLVA